jgi:hypothetical protein
VVLLTLPLARGLLTLIGLGGLVAGALIAWDSQSATPLLIISAVFLALGLFDWNELTARHGESSVTLKRTREQIEEVAARDDISEPAREQLQEAARSIEFVTTASVPTSSLQARRDALVRMLMVRPDVKIEQEGNSLLLTFEPRMVYTMPGPFVRCGVTSPAGRTAFSEDRPWGTIILAYPEAFAGAETLTAGEYLAQWYQHFEGQDTLSKVAEARYRVP